MKQTIAATIALFILIFLSMETGPSSTSLLNSQSTLNDFVLMGIRFPRTMACVFVGAALGLSGLLLQTFLKNPLAEPYTLGLSGGATLGAVLTIALSLQPQVYFVPLGAIIGCWIVTALLLFVERLRSMWRAQTLILVGVMISFFCGALVTLLVTWLEPTKLQKAIFWMLGQVGSERDTWWPSLSLGVLATTVWGLRNSTKLDQLLLGDDVARSLGVNVRSLRIQLVLLVTVLTSISVAIAGLLGFVGLLSPHGARLLLNGPRHKWTILVSALLGACFLLAADMIGRIIGGTSEIPAGSLTALIGAPLLFYLLIRRRRYAIAS